MYRGQVNIVFYGQSVKDVQDAIAEAFQVFDGLGAVMLDGSATLVTREDDLAEANAVLKRLSDQKEHELRNDEDAELREAVEHNIQAVMQAMRENPGPIKVTFEHEKDATGFKKLDPVAINTPVSDIEVVKAADLVTGHTPRNNGNPFGTDSIAYLQYDAIHAFIQRRVREKNYAWTTRELKNLLFNKGLENQNATRVIRKLVEVNFLDHNIFNPPGRIVHVARGMWQFRY